MEVTEEYTMSTKIKAMAINKEVLNKIMKEKGFNSADETMRYLVSSGRIFEVAEEFDTQEDAKDAIKEAISNLTPERASELLFKIAGKENAENLIENLIKDYHNTLIEKTIEYMEDANCDTLEAILGQYEIFSFELADDYGQDKTEKMIEIATEYATKNIANVYNAAVQELGEDDDILVARQTFLNSIGLAVEAGMALKKAEIIEGTECNCDKCTAKRNKSSEKNTMKEIKELVANKDFDSFEEMMSEVAKLMERQ